MTAMLYGLLGWLRDRRERESPQTLDEHRAEIRNPNPPTQESP